MFCRQLSHSIIQLVTAAVFLLGGSGAFAVNGPSFDCSRGVRQTLAAILCTNQEAAQADWDLSTAYWASSTDNGNEKEFAESVYQRCALPRVEMEQERTARIIAQGLSGGMFGMPTPQPVTEQHVRCVISAFHNQAALLRNRLTGDALAESNLSPDQHKDIQIALARKGFLQNRVRGYGANADGQFGPNTRAAIKDFQRSIGAQATGYLSNEQRTALMPQTVPAGAGSSAQSLRNLSVQIVCRSALNFGQSAWDQDPKYSEYVAEATRRGLTIDACREMLSQPLPPQMQPRKHPHRGRYSLLKAVLAAG
jgi:hypothetical protein